MFAFSLWTKSLINLSAYIICIAIVFYACASQYAFINALFEQVANYKMMIHYHSIRYIYIYIYIYIFSLENVPIYVQFTI